MSDVTEQMRRIAPTIYDASMDEMRHVTQKDVDDLVDVGGQFNAMRTIMRLLGVMDRKKLGRAVEILRALSEQPS